MLPSVSTFLTEIPNSKVTPISSKRSLTAAETSSSSRGINASNTSTTVTLEPNCAYVAANSNPINPLPTITTDSGNSSKSIIVSFV